MKAWVYVEGPSDKLALEALWKPWRNRLRQKRHGLVVVPMETKANLLKKLGPRAAEKLRDNDSDVVVGLPDLYPAFGGTGLQHSDVASLKELQQRLVREALVSTSQLSRTKADHCMTRFLPAVFKHDFEMLLLAAKDALRSALGTNDRLGNWRLPVEDQNFDQPPKRVIEDLFRTKSVSRRSYLETRDAPKILGSVTDLGAILRTDSGAVTCPEFVAVLRWLGDRFDEHCCTLP
ncbi:MAG: DUF4276 family protein [Planctomycetota bacterium]